MKIVKVPHKIDDVELGGIFLYDEEIWIKTNASHDKAGFQCVTLDRGGLSYLDKGTKVMKVEAELRVFT